MNAVLDPRRFLRLLSAALLASLLGASLPAAAQAPIDINTAGLSELTRLKGIGPTKAEAIVAYREKNGPFHSVDDLTRVKGIGRRTVDKIRDRVTVGRGQAAPRPATTAAPAAGAEKPRPAPATAAAPRSAPAGDRIDINTAGASELTRLKGIGPSKAAAIIAYREKNGPFRSVDDLTRVKGIGRRTVDKIRERITAGR